MTLASTETEPGLPSPTALAFSALTGGQVQFYAATAGREAADLVALDLGSDQSVAIGLPTPSSSIAELVPLQESSLPLVANILTLTISVSEDELGLGLYGGGSEGTTAFLPGTAVTVGQSLASARATGDFDVELPRSGAPGADARPCRRGSRGAFGLGADDARAGRGF